MWATQLQALRWVTQDSNIKFNTLLSDQTKGAIILLLFAAKIAVTFVAIILKTANNLCSPHDIVPEPGFKIVSYYYVIIRSTVCGLMVPLIMRIPSTRA